MERPLKHTAVASQVSPEDCSRARSHARRAFPLLLPALALLVCALLAYAPGLRGPFLFDDFPNIIDHPYARMENLDWEGVRNAALTNRSGPTGRPLPALSFALNYYLADKRFDKFAYKTTNLAIHAVNGLLVLLLIRGLLACFQARSRPFRAEAVRTYLPALIAGAWLLHPIHLTSVLYVVQRMNSMAALFVLAGLVLFIIGRRRLTGGEPFGLTLMFTGVVGGTGLGLLCKENAALLPLFALVIEVFAFDRVVLSRAARRRLWFFYLVTLGLPVVAVLALLVHDPGFIVGGYAARPFNLYERVLTEARVLFFYLGLILVPRLDTLSLFHDDMVLSQGVFEPWTTLLALAGWSLVLALALLAYARRQFVLAFAVTWFLAGHALESSVIALELAHEHRNYLPSFGILFAGFFVAARYADDRMGSAKPLFFGALPLLMIIGFVTHVRAEVWGDQARWIETALRYHPDSVRVNLSYAEHSLQRKRLDLAYSYYHRASQLAPSNVSALIEMAKIANILAAGLSRRDVETDTSMDAHTVPSSYLAPPVLEPGYLLELRRLMAKEIDRRIRTQPFQVATVAALRKLRGCIEARQDACTSLASDALTWLHSVLDRPGLRTSTRANVLFNIARLYVRQGRGDEAAIYIRRAWQMHPDDVELLVHEAALHIEQGDWEQAEETVATLAAQRHRPAFNSKDVEMLRGRLQALKDTLH